MTDSVAIIVYKNKRFLLTQRLHKQEFYPKFWAPVHGHIRDGESQEDAVKRIFKRALGIDAKPIRYLKTIIPDFSSSSLHWWLADIDEKPKINKKYVADCDWVTWSELMKMQLLPATKSMFETDLRTLVSNGKNGKFITIDGLDASGKGTQSKLLTEWIGDMGHIVNPIAFPMYEKHFGGLVAKYLRGEFGAKEELPTEVALLYSLDRYYFAPELRTMLDKGEWVVADRYTPSNIGYQAGKHKDPAERRRMADWIELVESRMPQPDIVIILKIDPELTQKLHDQRKLKSYMFAGMKKDIHDADVEFQKQVMLAYLETAARKPNWYVIDCMNKGSLRPVDEIQQEIRTLVKMTLFN